MRTSFVLLLAIIIFLTKINAVLGSTFKQHLSQDVIQLATTGEANSNERRALREEAKTQDAISQGDEERVTISNLVTRVSRSFKNWLNNEKFVAHLKKTVLHTTNYDDGAQKLMKEGVDPDVFYKAFKFHKEKNVYRSLNTWSDNYAAYTPQYELWQSLKAAWGRAYPAKKWQYNP